MSSRARTLMCVHAHPDDETITMGGTLARYSAEGVRTIVVTCTNGELGAAADQRKRELLDATAALGVSRVVELGYLDSGMPGQPENHRSGAFFATDTDAAATRLLRVIDEEHPTVLATYDETGGYGHPDHVKAHEVTVAAYQRLPIDARPRLYFVRFPITWSREYVAALRAAGIDAPGSAPSGADAGPEVLEIGVPDELVTTRIDVRGYLTRKRRALGCYPSQLPPDHFLMQMPLQLSARLWAFEQYSFEYGTRAPAEDLFGD